MKKLTKRWQMVIYAISGMGINMMNLMMGSYLCSALLIGGFGDSLEVLPYQTYVQKDLVIAALWSVFAFAAKVLDGIIDIPLASMTDNLRTRWGRRRPALVMGLIPLVLSYLLFLVVPDPSGVTLLNTIYYGVVLCVFYTCYTLVMVTYYATFTEIVETERERALISNVKSVCDILYFILGYVVVRMLLNGFNVRIVALMTLPLALTMLIPLFMVREKSTKEQAAGAKSVNLVKSIRFTMKNRPFVLWMIIYACMTFGVQLFLGGINEYFAFADMNMMLIMGSTFAPVPFTLILYNHICKTRGFGVGFKYILLVFSLGMFVLFSIGFMEPSTLRTIISLVGGIGCSFAVGALFAVAYSVPAQLAAEEAAKTGISNSAMYFAVQGLFSGVATGLATGVVLTALKKGSEGGSNAILYMTLISGVGTLVAALLMSVLPKSIQNMGKSAKD
ncbi:MAG: MFS transporter [Ruminococcaceae bacterium]|nr:MFS transporter [Oscillospiraceae bacterium]